MNLRSDSSSSLHETAIIEPGARIGRGVVIEAYAVVKATVTLEDHVTIKSHAYIDGNTTIGEGTTIWPFASIGTKTQDLKFRGEKTFVRIGKRCEIREFVTINSSCQENTSVEIGDDCLIMAYCHVAHNCALGNKIILANSVNLAGHVTIEDCVVIGGMTPVHQFCRIGAYAMVGGFSRITHDIPPYTIGAGAPYELGGLNLVGLKRHGFSFAERKSLSQAFRLTYRSGLSLKEALERLSQSELLNSTRHWIEFCRSSKRGLIGFTDKHPSLQNAGLEEELEEV